MSTLKDKKQPDRKIDEKTCFWTLQNHPNTLFPPSVLLNPSSKTNSTDNTAEITIKYKGKYLHSDSKRSANATLNEEKQLFFQRTALLMLLFNGEGSIS